MTAQENARLLGLLLWLLTGFQVFLIFGIGLLYAFIVGIAISTGPQKANDPPPELIVGIILTIFIVIIVFTVLFSIPKIVAGYGLRKRRSWAKVWAIIACIMACMSFPFGTAVGVYGLVFIFGDQGRAYFDYLEYGRIPAASNMPPPPPNSWQ
jgi:hypothetical protein